MGYEPRIGMKVVCIKEGLWNGDPDADKPVNGLVYTIRGVDFGDGTAWLTFDEIRNPVKLYFSGMHEACFNADSFRPVQRRATDISIFTQMLNPSKVDA